MPVNPSDATVERDRRLLEALRPVCSHDLPNQIVALQGMLQLFRWDEAQNLTTQGQEYFERLWSIAGKTAALAQFLKELIRLQQRQACRENIVLAPFVQELQAELVRDHPDQSWTWRRRFAVDCLQADRGLLRQGCLHLLQSAAGELGGAEFVIDMATAAQPDHIEWTVCVHSDEATSARAASTVAPSQRQPALVLAQECLAAADIALRPSAPPGERSISYGLEIPTRTPHD